MILSRILMVLALAVLAFLVWFTINSSSNTNPKPTTTAAEKFTQQKQIIFDHQPLAPAQQSINYERRQENFEQAAPEQVLVPVDVQVSDVNNITYEKQNVVSGLSESVYGAAPFGSNAAVEEGDMATVKYTGMVDGEAGDVIQIEGTDLLTAPLVDNMLYTNSIANTNRNASQDLRGDLPLQFNDTYTPFYSSVIYGAPLSQKQMTIGNI
jgi:hypothetical protein